MTSRVKTAMEASNRERSWKNCFITQGHRTEVPNNEPESLTGFYYIITTYVFKSKK